MVDAGMEIGVDESRAPYTVVSLTGEVDIAAAPSLRQQLIELVNQGHHMVIVDLSAVDFVDSSGISVLVYLLNQLRMRGGVLRVVATKAHVLKVFEVTGLLEALSISNSIDAAVNR